MGFRSLRPRSTCATSRLRTSVQTIGPRLLPFVGLLFFAIAAWVLFDSSLARAADSDGVAVAPKANPQLSVADTPLPTANSTAVPNTTPQETLVAVPVAPSTTDADAPRMDALDSVAPDDQGVLPPDAKAALEDEPRAFPLAPAQQPNRSLPEAKTDTPASDSAVNAPVNVPVDVPIYSAQTLSGSRAASEMAPEITRLAAAAPVRLLVQPRQKSVAVSAAPAGASQQHSGSSNVPAPAPAPPRVPMPPNETLDSGGTSGSAGSAANSAHAGGPAVAVVTAGSLMSMNDQVSSANVSDSPGAISNSTQDPGFSPD